MSSKQARLTPPVGPDDHTQGPHDAPVTLVEYGDYECPYCGKAYPIVKRIQKRLGNRLRFVFRNFPLSEVHPNAVAAAEMAEAAAAEGRFWEMHDMLFEHQRALNPTNLHKYARMLDLYCDGLEVTSTTGTATERVRSDFASGVRSGVNGTPTFFINGERFDGDWSNEDELFAALTSAAR